RSGAKRHFSHIQLLDQGETLQKWEVEVLRRQTLIWCYPCHPDTHINTHTALKTLRHMPGGEKKIKVNKRQERDALKKKQQTNKQTDRQTNRMLVMSEQDVATAALII